MTRWRIPLLLFVGSLLLQFAWIVALPPFRGIDEFDHAYRATAVAHGEWVVDSYVSPPHTWGYLITVPRDLVHAASRECQTYAYVGYDNCHPVRTLPHGMVTVASSAARYNPLFYWVIGTVAKPFAGASALYAMRITAAVLCSALLALAGYALERWKNPKWALMSLFGAMTPMVVYSTALPAPNGIEMMAGLTLWACLLGLARVAQVDQRKLLWISTAAAVILATVRSLGPLWLALILLTCVGITGPAETRAIVHRHRRTLVTSILLVGTATLAGALWTLTQGTNSPSLVSSSKSASAPIANTLKQLPLWLFQTMGAFPTRNEMAPMELYAVFTVVFAAIVGVSLWRGDLRTRSALAAVCTCSYLVPTVLVLLTFSRLGGAWQGRYELPYSIGIPVVAALALTQRPVRHRLVFPVLLGGWLAIASAQVVGVAQVLVQESQSSPLAGTDEWHIPPLWLIVSFTITGMLAWALAAQGSSQRFAHTAFNDVAAHQPLMQTQRSTAPGESTPKVGSDGLIPRTQAPTQ